MMIYCDWWRLLGVWSTINYLRTWLRKKKVGRSIHPLQLSLWDISFATIRVRRYSTRSFCIFDSSLSLERMYFIKGKKKFNFNWDLQITSDWSTLSTDWFRHRFLLLCKSPQSYFTLFFVCALYFMYVCAGSLGWMVLNFLCVATFSLCIVIYFLTICGYCFRYVLVLWICRRFHTGWYKICFVNLIIGRCQY